MTILWMIESLLVLMAGSFGVEPSSRSKRNLDTSRETTVWHSFYQNDDLKEDFERKVVMYENLTNVQDTNNQIDDFFGFVRGQTWEMALMSTPKKKIALWQIWELHHTLVIMNEGYYKAKVDK